MAEDESVRVAVPSTVLYTDEPWGKPACTSVVCSTSARVTELRAHTARYLQPGAGEGRGRGGVGSQMGQRVAPPRQSCRVRSLQDAGAAPAQCRPARP